jgi:peptide/nickel transport system substrate-binding protein
VPFLHSLRLACALAALGLGTAQAAEPKIVRAVMDAELSILDPHATNAYVTRTVGYLVYDMLFGQTSAGEIRPQMVETYQASADNMTWEFTLRPGLVFSDGQPVTSRDVIPSLQRWGKVDAVGRELFAHIGGLEVKDDRTFILRLSRAFGFVLHSLGKPSSFLPVIMPERLAVQEPSTTTKEIIGSGPFIFRADQWVPGSLVAFDRNTRYVPRAEPPDAFAGGKRVNIDRVEFRSIPDPSTKVAALGNGEVDYIQLAPLDLLPMMQRNPAIIVMPPPPVASWSIVFRPNFLQPPFDNPKVRQVLQVALSQEDVLAASGVPQDQIRSCLALFMCGGVFETTVGSESFVRPNIDRARTMLRESGYLNERIVLLHSTDVQAMDLPATVVASTLREVGFNVDDVAMDWPSIAVRRQRRTPVNDGGWSGYTAISSGYDMASPFSNLYVAYNCGNFPGWSCDETITSLLAQFSATVDPAKQKELAAQIQQRSYDLVAVVGLGQLPIPQAHRTNLHNVVNTGFPIFWGMEKQ